MSEPCTCGHASGLHGIDAGQCEICPCERFVPMLRDDDAREAVARAMYYRNDAADGAPETEWDELSEGDAWIRAYWLNAADAALTTLRHLGAKQ